MPADTPTPGETAYAAYWRTIGPSPPGPWRFLAPGERAAWEAAAEAVRSLPLTADEARRVREVFADTAVQAFIARDYGRDWEEAVQHVLASLTTSQRREDEDLPHA